jgi:hypothetical protein
MKRSASPFKRPLVSPEEEVGWVSAMVSDMLSLSLILRPTVSRPVCLGTKHLYGAYGQIFLLSDSCGFIDVGAISGERTGLSFTNVSGPRQRSHSRVRDPWNLRP